jgi:hypothetical protein
MGIAPSLYLRMDNPCVIYHCPQSLKRSGGTAHHAGRLTVFVKLRKMIRPIDLTNS